MWHRAGLQHPLTNPFQGLTKGELLERGRNQGLLERLARRTISCARPVVSRWRGAGAASCGYCYPCLLRRAALHRLGWDDESDYALDVLAAADNLRHRVRGRDLRGLLLALKTWEEHPGEIEARLWLGETGTEIAARYPQARAVLVAGFAEAAAFFRASGPGWLGDYLA